MALGDVPWALLTCLLWLARRNDVARCAAVSQFQSLMSFILNLDFTVFMLAWNFQGQVTLLRQFPQMCTPVLHL